MTIIIVLWWLKINSNNIRDLLLKLYGVAVYNCFIQNKKYKMLTQSINE